MLIFVIDENGLFIGEELCQESPLEPGTFLYPSDRFTTVPPPEAGENQIQLFTGESWILIPDFRGTTVFEKATAQAVEWRIAGDLPMEYTVESPEGFRYPIYVEGEGWKEDTRSLEAEKASTTRKERARRMATTLNRIDRYRNQKEARIKTTDSKAVYRSLLRYLQALRDVPGQPGFPSDVNWPVEP